MQTFTFFGIYKYFTFIFSTRLLIYFREDSLYFDVFLIVDIFAGILNQT